MRLLLVRHGVAIPSGGPIARDAERPLTRQGERRFRRVAAGLARIAPRPRAILTSPLVRAKQTADLLAQAWEPLTPTSVPALATGDEHGVLHALAGYADDDTVVLVGHEDWISQFTARLLGSQAARAFRYRKGGVALLDVKPGDWDRAALLWFIPPRVFRKL